MNKMLTIALLGATGLTAAPASAIAMAPSNTASYHISGTLPPSCSITAPADQTINPTLTTSQPIGLPSYQCNFAGSPKLKFWSLNGSSLKSANSSVGYTFAFDGSAPLTLPTSEASTAGALTGTTTAANTAHIGPASITIGTGAIIAGTYSDTISMSINP